MFEHGTWDIECRTLVGHWMSDGGPPGYGVGIEKEGGPVANLGQRKGPKGGVPKGPLIEQRLGYRRPFPARAERTIKRKHKAQSAR